MYNQTEKAALTRAMNIISSKWGISEGEPVTELTSANATREYLKCYLADGLKQEYFAVIFLNAKHGLIATETLFMGTIDGAAVYPREVARRALELGASAVVLGHNHPSGDPEPSRADKRLTERLTAALGLLDIRVLDHIIVAGTKSYSFAEEGLI